MWEMFHKQNAIEAMAVTIRFAEPVGSLVVKRMVRDVEHHVSELGLIDRKPVQELQVDIGPHHAVRKTIANGMLFERNSLVKIEDGPSGFQLMQQVAVEATHLSYQTWSYRRWSKELADILKLLGSAFKSAVQNVPVSAIRVEYLDRFVPEPTNIGPDFRSLLKQSEFIAPKALEAKDLWHSHVGWFDEVQESSRKLLQINHDFQELNAPHRLAGKRAFALMTGAERQYPRPGREIDEAESVDLLNRELNILHDDVIDLFKRVVNDEFKTKNGLPS